MIGTEFCTRRYQTGKSDLNILRPEMSLGTRSFRGSFALRWPSLSLIEASKSQQPSISLVRFKDVRIPAMQPLHAELLDNQVSCDF